MENVIGKGRGQAASAGNTSERSRIERSYRELESELEVKEDSRYGSLVNFPRNMRYPIHRWFSYDAGFSAELVDKMIRVYSPRKGSVIFDPFCGSGTTLLTSKRHSLKGVGLDTNPFCVLAARAKTRNYSPEDIRRFGYLVNEIKALGGVPSLPAPRLKIINRLFDEDILRELLLVKERILQVEGESVRDLLMFGWLSVLESVSNYRKGGNGLKRRRGPRPESDVRKALLGRYRMMLDDLSMRNLSSYTGLQDYGEIEPEIHLGDALGASDFVGPRSVKGTIFSPPYANCFDYCEIYKVELWMGDFVRSYDEMRELRRSSMHSHLNFDWRGSRASDDSLDYLPEMQMVVDHLSRVDLWSKNIPNMLSSYFGEMRAVLEGLYEVHQEGSFVVIVVGNPAYGNLVVPSDLFIAKTATEAGFDSKGIVIARRNETSSQQQTKLGRFKKYLRESIVFLET